MVTSCSTEKTGWAHRSYHNTTARYNGFFNAKESVKEGIESLQTSNEEDYTKILPIYVEGDEISSKGVYPQMDRAIEKSSVVIERHSMPKRKSDKAKKIEYCRWIDDNYFLIGQAYYFKREFSDAKRLLEYVSRSPEYKHSSTRFDAMLWLSKTYLEEGEYDEAQKMLDILTDAREESEKDDKDDDKKARDKKKKRKPKGRPSGGRKKKKRKKKSYEPKPEGFPKYLKDDVFAVQADLLIRQGRYSDAIVPLEEAIVNAKKKDFKARLLFILAQLYQEVGDKSNASLTYGRVIKLHPDYEMEFYARINRALNANLRSADTKALRAELLKMLKDDKNSQWYDQLYYALADLELRDRNEDLAIDYLVLSTQVSKENNRQKGLSFLKLGDIHFKKRLYRQSQAYYDSTVTFLPQDHEDYQTIANKAEYLTELVDHLETVERQDSLLALCNLSEAERLSLIQDIIQDKIDEEERLLQEELVNQLNPGDGGRPTPGGDGTGANWYFYNTNTRSIGFSEFRRQWGERKFEDNWRRSDKSSQASAFDEVVETPEDSVGTGDETGDDKKPEFYLKDLPCGDDKKLAASHDEIIEALYGAGIIYKEKLSDNKEAIGAFTNLVNRYDTCKYQLPGYYQLYRLHLAQDDEPKANEYKNLLSAFPDSEYWKVIVDPDFKKKDEQQRIADLKEYERVVDMFQRGFYPAVMNSVEKTVNNDQDNYYLAKYYMLRAQTASEMNALAQVEPSLRTVIDRFPGTPEAVKAQEYLDLLKTEEPAAESPFKVNNESQHLFVILFPDTKGSVRHLENKVSDFNASFFRAAGLRIESLNFGTEDKVISVKSFANQQEARDYYLAFKTNTGILTGLNDSYEFYTISIENYQRLYADKQYAEYKLFFEENYLN